MENCCTWKELSKKGKDWYEAGCLGTPVDPLKVAMKRGLTMVDIFKRCPFCGKPVVVILKDGRNFVPSSNETKGVPIATS